MAQMGSGGSFPTPFTCANHSVTGGREPRSFYARYDFTSCNPTLTNRLANSKRPSRVPRSENRFTRRSPVRMFWTRMALCAMKSSALARSWSYTAKRIIASSGNARGILNTSPKTGLNPLSVMVLVLPAKLSVEWPFTSICT
eukprot:scaffold334_cov241-Pinguiococcus_pyrenoidosus.AAC.73